MFDFLSQCLSQYFRNLFSYSAICYDYCFCCCWYCCCLDFIVLTLPHCLSYGIFLWLKSVCLLAFYVLTIKFPTTQSHTHTHTRTLSAIGNKYYLCHTLILTQRQWNICKKPNTIFEHKTGFKQISIQIHSEGRTKTKNQFTLCELFEQF